jgi:hypothetical protein
MVDAGAGRIGADDAAEPGRIVEVVVVVVSAGWRRRGGGQSPQHCGHQERGVVSPFHRSSRGIEAAHRHR